MIEEEISGLIIGKAIDVHRQLGPGLLESAYRECVCYELRKSGLTVVQEKSMPIIYKELKLDHGYRMDLLVENKVVVELKRVEWLHEVHVAQVLTYLRLGNYHLGILINFQETLLKKGIKRVVNTRTGAQEDLID